jgi:Domain of unknown function (DUF1874).
MKLVLLNAFPINAFPFKEFTVSFKEVDISRLRKDVSNASVIKCFIRHPSTVEVLSKLLGIKLEPSSELYRYEEGDIIYIITLRTPERGKEVSEVRTEELLIYYCVVLKDVWL